MRIERVLDPDRMVAAGHLFDEPPTPELARAFLAHPGHHLLFAYDESSDPGVPLGMIIGVEAATPDKGSEMFLSELGVDPPAQRRGVATALVHALAATAREHDCVAMWVAVDPDNVAALATYRRAGAGEPEPAEILVWSLT